MNKAISTRAVVFLLACVIVGAFPSVAQDTKPDPNNFAKVKAQAEAGDPVAARELGHHYWHGAGVAADFAEARKWYRKAAEQNNTGAQFDLAMALNSTNGGPKDMPESLKWLRKSAELNYPEAQFHMYLIYSLGPDSEFGVAKDDAEALKWLRKAAEGNHAQSQDSLANMYYSGRGVPKDAVEAAKWYRKSADLGFEAAWLRLGLCYVNGEGVPKDVVQAYKWLRLAASQNDQVAVAGLSTVSKEITDIQKAEGEKLARDFVPSAPSPKAKIKAQADAGDAKAQYELGDYYARGVEVMRDETEAVKWFRKAAEQNYAPAQASLGTYYSFGSGGLPMDTVQAYKWSALAAKQGNQDGKNTVELLEQLGMTSDQKAAAEKLVREFTPNKAR
jgi:uncharacterized protein